MKNIVSTSLFVLLATAFSGLQAQIDISQLHAKAKAAIGILENQTFEVVKVQFDIIRESSKIVSFSRGLSPDYTYKIYALGDGAVSDMDVFLLDDEDHESKLLVRGDNDDNASIITFKPEEWRQYNIAVRAEEFAAGEVAGYYCVIIAHDLPSSSAPDPDPTVSSSSNATAITSAKQVFGRTQDDGAFEVYTTSARKDNFQFNLTDKWIKHTYKGKTTRYTVQSASGDASVGLTFKVTNPKGDDMTIFMGSSPDVIEIRGSDSVGDFTYRYIVE